MEDPNASTSKTLTSKASKKVTSLIIDDNNIIILILHNGKQFCFPLEYIIFGSKTSLDCDLIIQVPVEFTELNFNTDVFNIMCEIFDKLLGPIIGTTKVINSSLGYWNNGRIMWAQKGSETSEVNNSIMLTFHNHRDLQMYNDCPIYQHLERDLVHKINTTIRDILCKMNKTRYNGNDDEILNLSCNLVIGILHIPEIQSYDNGTLKSFLFALLQGICIPTKLAIILYNSIDTTLHPYISSMETSPKNKNLKKKPIELLVSAVLKKDDAKISEIVHQIFVDNNSDAKMLSEIISQPSISNDTRNELEKIYETGVIRLNRLIRNVRRIQFLGVRIDLLRLLDFSKIIYVIDPSDRYKDITFKIGQCMALINDIELYDKDEIARRYPELSIFLWRKKPSINDLIGLNTIVISFLDMIISHHVYNRNLCEDLRHNNNNSNN